MKRLFTVAILFLLAMGLYAKPIKTLSLKADKSEVINYYIEEGYSISKSNNIVYVEAEDATFNGLPVRLIALIFDDNDKLKIETLFFTDYTYKTIYETILMVTMAFECKIQSMRLEPTFTMITYSEKEHANYVWSFQKKEYIESYMLNIAEKMEDFSN